jgi:hypothetical protein
MVTMHPKLGFESDPREKEINVLTKLDRDYHQRARHASVKAGLSLTAWMREVLETAVDAEWPFDYRSDPEGIDILGTLPPTEESFDRPHDEE